MKTLHEIHRLLLGVMLAAPLFQHEPTFEPTLEPEPDSAFTQAAPEPPAEPPPKMTVKAPDPTFAAVLRHAVQINEELPAELMTATKKRWLVGLAPSWCTACPVAKERLKEHPALAIDWQAKEHRQATSYPAIFDPETDCWYFGAALASWDTLIAAINETAEEDSKPLLLKSGPTKAINVGSIDREMLSQVLAVLGGKGSASLGNDVYHYSEGMFALRLPENITLKWSSANGITRFEFTPKPAVGFSAVKQQVSAVVISRDLLTLQIDWFPDVTFTLR